MNIRQERELIRQAEADMRTIWSGKTEYWDEIVDAFSSAGLNPSVNKKEWVIKVSSKDFSQANGILMDLNDALEGEEGW